MKKFNQLNVQKDVHSLQGDKIKIDKLLNQEIEVHSFKVEQSKVKEGTMYLQIQIKYKGEERVVFTGSGNLRKALEQIAEEDFPFSTTIVKENQGYQFT